MINAGANVLAVNDDGETALLYRLRRTRGSDLVQAASVAAAHIQAGAPLTQELQHAIHLISEDFEQIREAFDEAALPGTEAALAQLLKLFSVEPAAPVVRHDGVSPIKVNAAAWPDRFNALWDYLVPAAGSANTVQGEVIRVAGRIAAEIGGNGGANWNSRYREMLSEYPAMLASAVPLPDADRAEARALARALSRGRGNEEELDRIRELATRWVGLNPTPIPHTPR
ncbi:hypothetical protein JOF28_000191 [Leucobacter exalbidus]|uniref:Uncharacterized protein n=1 Tax=Leucobacter exalbidus TaxID=662960 RepID=A0A940T2T9_9MICO|nr:hypothetical protein [Leucobacter exalbidus]MBP1324959.1 hypothetical protein [Leucobacter exalbidus]